MITAVADTSRDPGALFALLAGVFGLVFVGAGLAVITKAWRDVHRARRWPRVEAALVSAAQERRVSGGGDGGSRVRYVLVATYRYPHPVTGEPVEGTGDVPGRMVVSPDAPFQVAHDPDDPSRSLLPDGSIGTAVALTAIAGMFLVVGLVALAVGVAVVL